ncbi:MAG TPA: hypothetical protein VK590_11605 [Saprospiraceae bacterium]|nr:hypothetical protein [Saprospiraceae bacterium]
MKWLNITEDCPKENIWLLVFRKNKYIIAKYTTFNYIKLDEKDEPHETWVTQQNIVHGISNNDSWMYFEHITLPEKKYDH